MGRGESLVVQTSTEWSETPSAGGALTAGLGKSGSGLDLGEIELCAACRWQLVEWEIFILGGSVE